MLLDGKATSPVFAGRLQVHWRLGDIFLAAVMFFAVFAATWQAVSATHPDISRIFRRHKHQLIKVDDAFAYPMPSICWDRG